MSEVLLYSGGVDSFIAYWYLNRPPVLFVDLGLKSNVLEKEAVWEASRKYSMNLTIVSLPLIWVPVMSEMELPCRNMYLVLAGSHFADRIWLIVQRGELNLSDRSPTFMVMASEMLTQLWNGTKKEVCSPFVDRTKVEMVQWYVDNVGTVDELDQSTICCYRGKVFCGECSACFRKWVALRLNGGGRQYDELIVKGGLLEQYTKRAEERDPKLGTERIEEILAVNELLMIG